MDKAFKQKLTDLLKGNGGSVELDPENLKGFDQFLEDILGEDRPKDTRPINSGGISQSIKDDIINRIHTASTIEAAADNALAIDMIHAELKDSPVNYTVIHHFVHSLMQGVVAYGCLKWGSGAFQKVCEDKQLAYNKEVTRIIANRTITSNNPMYLLRPVSRNN